MNENFKILVHVPSHIILSILMHRYKITPQWCCGRAERRARILMYVLKDRYTWLKCVVVDKRLPLHVEEVTVRCDKA
jgi:hypothetical protein